MDKIFFLCAVLFVSCSAFKSGLTIPANETFILGEYNTNPRCLTFKY